MVASCPDLAPMPTDQDGTVTMGTLLDKLVEVAGTYRECQAAALGRKDTNVRKDKAGASGAPQP